MNVFSYFYSAFAKFKCVQKYHTNILIVYDGWQRDIFKSMFKHVVILLPTRPHLANLFFYLQ